MRLWLLPAVLLLAACVAPGPPPMPLPEADVLLSKLQQQSGAVRSLDGEAKVAVDVAGRFFSSQQFILLARPDRLRTDVLSSFGQVLLQLAVDGEQLRVFNNTKVPGIFYQGRASDGNLARFTRLPAHFRDLVRMFLYDPPLLSGDQLAISQHDGGARLTIVSGERHQEIVVDRQWRLIESRYYRQKEQLLGVAYADFDEESGFPRKIRLNLPRDETTASVRFSMVRTNPDIPAERFVIEPPANARLEILPD